MRRPGRRTGAATAAAAVAAVITLALSTPAQAATDDLTLIPSRGNNLNVAELQTPRACSGASTYVQSRLEGPGFADSAPDPAAQGYGYNISGNSAITAYETTAGGGLRIPLLLTFQAAADNQVPPTPLRGIHTITTRCKNVSPSSPIYDTFVVRINFTSPTEYAVVGDAAAAAPSMSGSEVPPAPTSAAPSRLPLVTPSPTTGSPAPTEPASAANAMSGGSEAQASVPPDAHSASSASPPRAGQTRRSAGSPGSLPWTGADVSVLVGYGVVLIGLGIAAITFARRRGFSSFGKGP
ncbi:MAG: hypothetical protein ABIM89_07045 [Mycobacteriales bacterium]